MTESPANDWAIVELMGHRTRAGRISEVERFGAKLLCIEVPDGDAMHVELYGAGAIYALRPVAEDVARARAARYRWMPALIAAPAEDDAALEAAEGKGADF